MDALGSFSGLYKKRIVEKAYHNRIPISGTFELLPTCNMKCRMCYIQHTPRSNELKKTEFWMDVFEQAISEGMLFALLTGGEPFMHPEFFEIYEQLNKYPVYFCINTNGTLLTREYVKRLAQKPPSRINVSLYGASDETYHSLCGNPNGFSQVMHAFDLLEEYGIPYRVHSVLVPENVQDYPRIIDICNERRVPLSMADYMFPSYRKDQRVAVAQDRFDPKALARVSLKYLHDHFKGDEPGYKKQVFLYCAAMENPEIYSLYNHDTVACKGGFCSFWVDWQGGISACGMHNQGRLDLNKTPFKEAWGNIVADTEKLRLPSKCKTCKYRCICQVCPAACFCETGRMDGVPEYLCDSCVEYGNLLMAERERIIGEK